MESLSTLTWADFVVIGILVLSCIVGLWRGFIVEVCSLLIWGAAFWLGFRVAPLGEAWFAGSIEVPSVRLVIAFALVFLAVLILGGLLLWLITRLVRGTGLSGTDRMLGFAFGLVRGVLVVTLLVLAAGMTPMPRDPWWQESSLLPTFQRGAVLVAQWMPESLRAHLGSLLDSGAAGVPKQLPAPEAPSPSS